MGRARRPRLARLPEVALVLTVVLPGAARAGPYETGDASEIRAGSWSIDVASDAAFDASSFEGSLPQLEVNYGAFDGVQLHVVAPLDLAIRSGERARYGPGDVALGVKLRLLGESAAGIAIATYPSVTLPTGSEASGLGSGRLEIELPLWFQKTLGSWTLYGGGGYRTYARSDAADRIELAFLAEWRRGPMRLGAEVYRRSRFPKSLRGRTGINVGAIVDVSGPHHLMITVGVSTASRPVETYLAWQLTFGG